MAIPTDVKRAINILTTRIAALEDRVKKLEGASAPNPIPIMTKMGLSFNSAFGGASVQTPIYADAVFRESS